MGAKSVLSIHMDKHRTGYCNIVIVFYIILISIITWSAAPASGDIYRWKDKEGNWHFTDSPTSSTPLNDNDSSKQTPSARSSEKGQTRNTDTNGSPRGGLLWRISSNGHPPSFLLGTIHSEDPRVTQLKTNVTQALDNSHRFIMEMKLDTNAFMHFGATMLMEQGQDLENMVGKNLFSQIMAAMAELGMPETVVRRMKPWVVMSMLSMPKPKGGLILDMVLYQRATGQGKPTSGLETAEEQLSVFEGLSREDQIALLEMTIEHLPSRNDMFEALIEAYMADNLKQILNLAAQYNQHNQIPAAKRFMVRLNDERNQRMVQRIIPYLQQGNSFIAVGALHLGGHQGLLSLLKNKGYKVDSVR